MSEEEKRAFRSGVLWGSLQTLVIAVMAAALAWADPLGVGP